MASRLNAAGQDEKADLVYAARDEFVAGTRFADDEYTQI
jgi:hypothetical protein